MGFRSGMGDAAITISKLAAKVYAAYKDAPIDYKYVSEEVNPLQRIINESGEHFDSITQSNNDRMKGQKILKSCQDVLGDLNLLIEKYNSLVPTNPNLVFQNVKLGTKNIETLRTSLASSTTSLCSFIQRFDISTIHI